MKNFNLLSATIVKCIFIFPITYTHADVITQAHQQTQRILDQQWEVDLKTKEHQDKWHAEIRERENKRLIQNANQRQNNKTISPEKIKNGLKDLNKLLDSDEPKNAMTYMENLQPDPHQVKQVDPVNTESFYFNPSPQNPDPEFRGYQFGNGGGVNENQLFNPNLGRQK